MAINVTCPKCFSRFTVGDQHAGKQGACPKCKGPITIPEADEGVVIHETPDGPTDAKGRQVLKTAKRKDGKFNPVVAAAAGGVALLAVLAALLLRGSTLLEESTTVLAAGALVMGPLLAWSGYQFLRDAELEPYSGGELWLRSFGCGAVYALSWLAYMTIAGQLGGAEWQAEGLEIWQMLVPAAVAVGVATFAGVVAFDLEPLMAFSNCALYFVATVGLRLLAALPAVPGLVVDG
ncbi:hypothetical protein Mal64_09960 [Pseudobythopirellula maris]|uniref:Uncharacterized protein n=1 Tax=Pseudobythopirellula maris TaxID=2527991 RepID=A0A5C5ZST7_9BACT|nr:hypothetical protein [Pseudobythopirellula maris]TWT90602.1 hypothetical protein Mal64_09960 [Pseudobythopirellula maris]